MKRKETDEVPFPQAGKVDAKKRLERDIDEIMTNNIVRLVCIRPRSGS